MQQYDKSSPQDQLFFSPWYNLIALVYLVVKTTFQPKWFWLHVSPLFANPQQARRLLLQALLGIEILWFCIFGLAWGVGLVVPTIGQYNEIGWFINILIIIITPVIIATIIQTTYDTRKAFINTASFSVYVLLSIVMLLGAAVIFGNFSVFTSKPFSVARALNLNLVLLAGLGYYLVLVRVLEYRRLEKSPLWLTVLLPRLRVAPLVFLWIALMFSAQLLDAYFIGGLEVFIPKFIGYMILVISASFIGALVAIIIAEDNIRSFSAMSVKNDKV